jgi:hypothetical protein
VTTRWPPTDARQKADDHRARSERVAIRAALRLTDLDDLGPPPGADRVHDVTLRPMPDGKWVDAEEKEVALLGGAGSAD